MKGNKWYKCDFHLHTSQSRCFRGSSDLDEWVQKVEQEGLNCIALTNHNSSFDIKALQEKCASKGIYVFPGVEITCSDAKVHLLVLFDVGVEESLVEEFLIKSHISKKDFGDENAHTSLNINEVAELAQTCGAVIIPAHIDQYSSLKNVESSPSLEKFFAQPNVIGMQITKNPEGGIEAKVKRLYSCAEKNKVALLTFSDNPSSEDPSKHGLEGIGRQYTFVKMGERPNLESLKQALSMSDLRVKTFFDRENLPKRPEVYIESLKIIGAERFKNEDVFFNTGFNAIIGGRGSGKSSLIRLIRLVLDKEFELAEYSDIRKDFTDYFDEKESPVGSNATVEAVVVNGVNKYKIKLSNIKSSEALRRECYKFNGTDYEKIDTAKFKDVLDRFDIEVYSQRQLYELSKAPNHILETLDKKNALIYAAKGDASALREELVEVCRAERKLLAEEVEFNIAEEDLENINQKLFELEKLIGGDIGEFQKSRREIQDTFAICQKGSLDFKSVIEELDNVYSKISSKCFTRDDLEQVKSSGVESLFLAIENLKGELALEVKKISEKYKNDISEKFKDIQNTSFWKNKKKSDRAYEEITQDDKGKKLDELVKSKGSKVKILEGRNSFGERKKGIQKEISKIYGKLCLKYSDIRKLRIEIVQEFIPDKAELKIKFDEHKNLKDFEKSFRKLYGISLGTYDDDVKIIRDYLLKSSCVTESLVELSKILGNRYENPLNFSGRFIRKVEEAGLDSPSNILAILPTDNIKIKFVNVDGVESDLSKGSHGQKTSAVLSILLHVNNSLKIIDQPEDDLDSSLIYSLIVSNILNNKNSKQLLVVTHNANIPVNGDADLIISMGSGGREIGINKLGTLDEKILRDSVCLIMEGGPEAFRERAKKYGLRE